MQMKALRTSSVCNFLTNISTHKRFIQTTKTGVVATVFGATGFSGRFVVNLLANAGAQVVIPYRDTEKAYRHLKVLGDVGQLVPLLFNINDEQVIEKSVSHSQIVINLLARHYETVHWKFSQVNVESARKIATAAKKSGVERFVHVSALGASPDSVSAFLRSKYEGEQIVKEIFPTATIVRPAPMFGDIFDQLLMKLGQAVRDHSPFLVAPIPTNAKLQPLSGQDFAQALMAILSDPTTAGRTYELGGPKIYTMEQIIDELVFPHTRTEGGITVHIKNKWLRNAWIARYHIRRRPWNAWTYEDPDYFTEDKVVAPHALTIQNLGVKKLFTLEDMAGGTLGMFAEDRRPFNAATPSHPAYT